MRWNSFLVSRLYKSSGYFSLIRHLFFFFLQKKWQPLCITDSCIPAHWKGQEIHHTSSLKIDVGISLVRKKKHECSCLFPGRGGSVAPRPPEKPSRTFQSAVAMNRHQFFRHWNNIFAGLHEHALPLSPACFYENSRVNLLGSAVQWWPIIS